MRCDAPRHSLWEDEITELKRLQKEIDLIQEWKGNQLFNVHDKAWGDNIQLQSLYQQKIKEIIEAL